MISNERRDYYAGGLLVLIGAGAAIMGSRYQLGTLTKMGPGFVPTALGVMMVILGIAIAVANFYAQVEGEEFSGPHGHGIAGAMDKPDWWGWGFIIGGVLAFIFCAEYIGLIAATFLSVFVSSWGDRTATLKGGIALSLGLTVFGFLLFVDVLRVQLAPFQVNIVSIAATAAIALVCLSLLFRSNASRADFLYSIRLNVFALAGVFLALTLILFVGFVRARKPEVPLSDFPVAPFRETCLLAGVLVLALPGLTAVLEQFRLFSVPIGPAILGAVESIFKPLDSGLERLFGLPDGAMSGQTDTRYAASASIFGFLLFSYVFIVQIATRLGVVQ